MTPTTKEANTQKTLLLLPEKPQYFIYFLIKCNTNCLPPFRHTVKIPPVRSLTQFAVMVKIQTNICMQIATI